MAGALFRTKSIDWPRADVAASGEATLKRTLGPLSLVALGIGAIIGAGLFVRTAAAIAERAGPVGDARASSSPASAARSPASATPSSRR